MNFSSFVESIVHSPTPEGKNITTNSQDKVKQGPTDQHRLTGYRVNTELFQQLYSLSWEFVSGKAQTPCVFVITK